MGADYEGQELDAKLFRILFAVPWAGKKAKEFFCHHLRNSLSVIDGNLYLLARDVIAFADQESPRRIETAREAVAHIVEDLKKIGC